MTDKEKLEAIKAAIERLYNQSITDKNRQADRGLERAANASYGKSIVCKELLSFYNSLPEEPVSEDLENAAYKYGEELDQIVGSYDDDDSSVGDYAQEAFKAGAQWQKERSKLTWIDMNHIHRYIKDAMNLYIDKFQSIDGQQEVYQNVLERFNKEKKEGLV